MADKTSISRLLRRSWMAPLMLLLAVCSASSSWRTIPWPERLLLRLEDQW